MLVVIGGLSSWRPLSSTTFAVFGIMMMTMMLMLLLLFIVAYAGDAGTDNGRWGWAGLLGAVIILIFVPVFVELSVPCVGPLMVPTLEVIERFRRKGLPGALHVRRYVRYPVVRCGMVIAAAVTGVSSGMGPKIAV
jgi:hypothetical protein